MKKLLNFLVLILVLLSSNNVFSNCLNPQDISASSAVVICADNGKVLFEKNAYEKRSMASTTKIMTSLLAIEAADADDRDINITDKMVPVEGSSMGLNLGDVLPLSSLVKGMLTVSGNDAANSVAIALGGSLDLFSDMMNEKAKVIGMGDTHFVTPSGLDNKDHYSTAYDMALLGAYALENKSFLDICSQKKVDILFREPQITKTFYNENKMLKRYDGCLGVKTGFTKNSGRCLVSAAQRNDLRLVSVTLNAPDDWNDHEKMLDYGFSCAQAVVLDEKEDIDVKVVGSDVDFLKTTVKGPTKAIIDKNIEKNIKKAVYVPNFVYAPIKKDQIIGKIEYTLNGEIVAENNLFAKEDVNYVRKSNNVDKLRNCLKSFFKFFN